MPLTTRRRASHQGGDDAEIAAEVGEKVAGGDAPISIEPGTPLPTVKALKQLPVFRIVEPVVSARARRKRVCVSLCKWNGTLNRFLYRV
ncbi:MAG: hypothetical protein EPO07_14995 [Verrucomicrobia bacterium]|nr:MAG: hypothetical protein EPO07_14995 [Verrucomicrobiota bacterium]